MTVEVIWQDGTRDVARSWPALEAAVRRSPWNAGLGRLAFRREMRRRASIWLGRPAHVRVWSTSAALFADLEQVGFLRIGGAR